MDSTTKVTILAFESECVTLTSTLATTQTGGVMITYRDTFSQLLSHRLLNLYHFYFAW